ncbi:MAG: cysteine--tRNA ligase [Deltaproteobacteria bacterium]|nr:cysteine--tRNA ligase [Deltaproteobacteria bacterium]
MALRFYNTMTREKEEFVPLEPGRVRMYVCGATVYDKCHIGHARSQIVFDTIFRYLMHKGFEVTYVRNFTDIDDKIIARSNERGVLWSALVEENIGYFYRDMDALGVLRPTIEPRATHHIGQIVDIIGRLERKALPTPRAATFSTPRVNFPATANSRGETSTTSSPASASTWTNAKKDPLDFVLWKASKPGEPKWDSPWGEGRPGWHIECSAMSAHHLGRPFDIHGGGKDLVFPHHENEIAQSEGAFDENFARIWLHNGFVQFNQEKMAKSTGHFFTIEDVLGRYTPEALRHFLLSAHYRGPLEFSEQSVQESQVAMDRVYTACEALDKAAFERVVLDEAQLSERARALLGEAAASLKAFEDAMDDDVNTAKATGHLFDVVRVVNTAAQDAELRAGTPGAMLLTSLEQTFRKMRDILGLVIATPEEYRRAKAERVLGTQAVSKEEIEALIAQRSEARKAKNFAESDRIRDELAAKGVILKDSPEGTTWTVK